MPGSLYLIFCRNIGASRISQRKAGNISAEPLTELYSCCVIKEMQDNAGTYI